MAICTVGELKKALENFDDNMPLDLYACCYDRYNYVCIKRDRYELGREPMKIVVSIDDGFVKIQNAIPEEMELSD